MDVAVDVVHYILAVTMLGVCGAWTVLLRGIVRSFRLTPRMKSGRRGGEVPMVSVILPARNEEAFIGECLRTLSAQDYPRFEVIAVNDSSQDSTGEIIRKHAARDSRIVPVDARPKPRDWMGKNWACMEGYGRATGDILLFTDSDTTFDPGVMSGAVDVLVTQELDALTAVPRIRADDFWTRITLPMISVFLHTRFSPVRVNDPRQKTGYFFGSFFLMNRSAYEAVGTHRGVRREIIEDGALGRRTKDMGYRLRMLLADHSIEAVWARDGHTLWNGLKRLMVPLCLQSRPVAGGILAAVLFLLFLPFPMAAYSYVAGGTSAAVLHGSSLAASAMVLLGAVTETRVLRIKVRHALACPLGGAVIVGGFLAGMISARGKNSVSWRGRAYTLRDHVRDRIDV